jgi:hypothetical protein
MHLADETEDEPPPATPDPAGDADASPPGGQVNGNAVGQDEE